MNNTAVPTGWPPRGNMGEIVVRMRGVCRYFDPGSRRTLMNASFDVYRGEVFGLLGPSGSGKSTAARILAGWLTPSEGKAKVFGRSPRRRAVRARVSYLPQKPSDAGSQFLLQVIGFFRNLVKGVGLQDSRKNPPYRPRGKERIVAMKRVLVQKTRLVLLDEPFLDLEASDRSEMTQLIQAIAQQGRTVIICSRSLHDANAVCSRVAVLYRGEIQAVGTVPELLANRGNLPFIVDLLPDEAVGTLLEYICQTVGVPHQTNSLSSETQTERPREKMPLQGVHQPAESGADTVLLSLSKPAPCGCSQVAEPTTVNHELLAALTKPVERKHPLHPKL